MRILEHIQEIVFSKNQVLTPLCSSQIDSLISSGGGGQVDLLKDGGRPRDRQQADQEEEVKKDRPDPVRHFGIKMHAAKV